MEAKQTSCQTKPNQQTKLFKLQKILKTYKCTQSNAQQGGIDIERKLCFWEHFLTSKRGSVVGETEMYGTIFGSRKVADVSKYLSVLFKIIVFQQFELPLPGIFAWKPSKPLVNHRNQTKPTNQTI